jgi:transposase
VAGNGLNVKDLEEIKRLLKLGLTNRQIAKSIGVHRNTVNKYVEQIKHPDFLNFKTPASTIEAPIWTKEIDWENIRSEFLKGVPLNVLHEELYDAGKISILYNGFWRQVKKRLSLSEVTMVRIFKPGDRAEIDYADGIEILDPVTGEIQKTQLFVGVLCHSRYAFAEFTWTQSSADFLQSHVNMFEFFGGSTQVISPDNLKSAVTKTHRYDPAINQAYTKLAAHYEIGVVPARVRTPQDKAIVERTIQIFQRWFYMKVRHRTFTSLVELNKCLAQYLIIFNNKTHRIFKRTRSEMFQDERSHLKALPNDAYKVATYHRATLSRDCHLSFNKNFYSAPHWLRGQILDIWSTSKTVEIFNEGERVALHALGKSKSKFITDNKHYPESHQAYAEEDVQKLILKSSRTGIETEKLIRSLLESSQPLRYFRRVQGILALSWKHSPQLLEQACKIANQFNNTNLPYIERVIKSKIGGARSTEAIMNRAENPHLRGINNIH